MTIALSGSHRCGKTTLAKAFAEKNGVKFLETPTSAIFKELGLDPAVTYDFTTRLDVQETILKRFDSLYAQHAGKVTITDRSPIDLMAYTLGDVQGTTLNEDQEVRLAKYLQDCFDLLRKRFAVVLIVQPGIPLIYADGKAAMSKGYMEHFNTLCLGLVSDERMTVPHFYVPRSMISLEDRVAAVEYALGRVRKRAEADRLDMPFQSLH